MKVLLRLCFASCILLIFNCTKKASCSDGIANQGEKYTDCGGPCSACPTCFDGIQNQGEAGIDCGGGVCAPCNGAGSGKSISYPESGFFGRNILKQIPNDTIHPGETVSFFAKIGTEAKLRIRLVDLWRTSSMVPWAYPIGTSTWIQTPVTSGMEFQDFYAPGPLQPDIEFSSSGTSSDRQPFRMEFYENESTTPTYIKIVTILK